MSRRRRPRLIERNESARAGYPPTTQTFSTRSFADPINTYAYATPTRGVQNPQDTTYRGTSGAYGRGPIGAYNALSNTPAVYNKYDPASGRAYDATNANGAYNVATNANGPINEAGGAFSTFNAATTGVYNTYRGVNPEEHNETHHRYR